MNVGGWGMSDDQQGGLPQAGREPAPGAGRAGHVLEHVNVEEYYQANPEILAAFPKVKLPVDLYHYKEEIDALVPIYSAGDRTDEAFRAHIAGLCAEGLLFFSRAQQDVYTNFVAGRPEVVLADPNLLPSEVAEIFAKALSGHVESLFRSPVPAEFAEVRRIAQVLVSYLEQHQRRMEHFVHNVHKNRTRERKAVNAAFVGLALFLQHPKAKDVGAEALRGIALGFLLFDIGMGRISRVVTDKPQLLTPEERVRLHEHPSNAVAILRKLEVESGLVLEPALQHHERLDGSGYPQKLPAERIGLLGRISAIADSYCAIITDKPHAKARDPVQAAVDLLKKNRLYDQQLCQMLVRYLQQIPG